MINIEKLEEKLVLAERDSGITGDQYLQFIEDYYHSETGSTGFRNLDFSDQIIWLGKFLSEDGNGVRNRNQVIEITG